MIPSEVILQPVALDQCPQKLIRTFQVCHFPRMDTIEHVNIGKRTFQGFMAKLHKKHAIFQT